MESSDTKNESQSVQAIVNIRPLVTHELSLPGCYDCVTVTPNEPLVQIGPDSFTFDHVYGCTEPPSSRIFDDCVQPLIDALFKGYNATVLAYGQTGSGKTYTIGTNYDEKCTNMIMPKVMNTVFTRVEETKDIMQNLITISFFEIYKDQVIDLLKLELLILKLIRK